MTKTERTKGPTGMDSIRHYVEMRDRMPLSSLGDSVHSIHASTEFEAGLTLTDLKKACSAYNDLIAALDYIQMHSNEKDGGRRVNQAAIFLCDLTGNAARPWAEAGYDCYCVDIQHSIRKDRVVQVGAGRIHYVWGDVRSWAPPRGVRPVFGVSFTECTHVAGSGARDWPRKRGFMLRDALEQFEAARQAFEWAGIPYVQENSIGLLSSIPHIGKPSHYFHPWEYAGWCENDNYTKNTALWSGNGFVMPEKKPAPWLGPPDDRIHKATPGDDRANFRSASPVGFWTAVFHANNPANISKAAA